MGRSATLLRSSADGFSADTAMSPPQMLSVLEDGAGLAELPVDALRPLSASSEFAGCMAISAGCRAMVLCCRV